MAESLAYPRRPAVRVAQASESPRRVRVESGFSPRLTGRCSPKGPGAARNPTVAGYGTVTVASPSRSRCGDSSSSLLDSDD